MTLEELLALLEQAENAEALGELSLEEARALREQLQTGYNDVRPGVTDRDGVEALRRVVAAVGAVDTRISEMEQEADGLEQELADLDAAVNGPGEGETEGEGDGGEGAAEGEGEQTGTEGETEGAAEGEGEPAESRVAASARPSLDALNRTQRRRPAAEATPNPDEDPNMTRLVASSGMPNAQVGQRMTVTQLGRELAELHETMQVLTPQDLPHGGQPDPRTGEVVRAGGRKLILGHIPIADRPGVVHMQNGDGSEVIDQAVREYVAARDERLRKIAAGGDCVMAQPDYSVRLIGDRGTCFTDDIPTVAGNRPLAYYPWIQIDQSAGATGRGSRELADEGIGFVTSEEDAAGYGDPDIATGAGSVPTGGAPYKSCVHIDCPPEPLSCSQEAVYKCVTIGNFQNISHPEYVALFQNYMDVWFDIERDERALQSFVTEATAQSHLLTTDAGDKQFGAVSSLKDILARIVAKERSARHAPNLGFNIVAPDWFGGFLALDIMRHTFGSLENLRVTAQQAMAMASTDGIGALSTYCTETNFAGTPKQVLTPVTSGVVPDWPATARLLMYPDGALFKKTAGDLRFGLRETLMKTNDFGMFQESFEKVCYRGSVFVLDVTLCPNGATGAPVALTC